MHVLAFFLTYMYLIFLIIIIILSPCSYSLDRTWFNWRNEKVLLISKCHVYFNRGVEKYRSVSSNGLAVLMHSSLHLCFIRKRLVTLFKWYRNSLWLHVYNFSHNSMFNGLLSSVNFVKYFEFAALFHSTVLFHIIWFNWTLHLFSAIRLSKVPTCFYSWFWCSVNCQGALLCLVLGLHIIKSPAWEWTALNIIPLETQ